MSSAILPWLPLLALVSASLSAIVVWGFATGRFIQRHEAATEKVSRTEQAVRDEATERAKLADALNAALGQLQTQFKLLEQAAVLRDAHLGRWLESVDDRLTRLENAAAAIQRQVDRVDANRNNS